MWRHIMEIKVNEKIHIVKIITMQNYIKGILLIETEVFYYYKMGTLH